jgi:hypothetical protein
LRYAPNLYVDNWDSEFRMKIHSSTFWINFLLCTFLFCSAILVGIASTHSGPGVSPDSTSYINAAVNINNGRGYVVDLSSPFDTNSNSPLTLWPPGYSLMISLLMSAGLSVIDAAKMVPILSFGFLVCTTYWIGNSIGGRTMAILFSLLTLTHMPIVRIATLAMSDMPFTLCATLAIAVMIQYMSADVQREMRYLVTAGILTAMAIFIRYIGLLFFFAGLLLILLKISVNWREYRQLSLWKSSGIKSINFSIISLTPILPWFLRNWKITGYFTGLNRSEGGRLSFSENIMYLLRTLWQDLVPSLHLGIRSFFENVPHVFYFILAVFCFVSLIILSRVFWYHSTKSVCLNKKRVFLTLQCKHLPFIVLIVYAITYIVGLLILSAVSLFPSYDWQRYLTVIYPVIFMLIVGFWFEFVWPLSKRRVIRNWSQWIVIFLLPLTWIMVNGNQTVGFIKMASQGQQYTLPYYRNSQGIKYLSYILSEEDLVYSTHPDLVLYYLNHPTKFLPYRGEMSEFVNLIDSKQNTLVNEYIIAFKWERDSSFFRPRLTQTDLAILAKDKSNIRVIIDLEDSVIYQLGTTTQ